MQETAQHTLARVHRKMGYEMGDVCNLTRHGRETEVMESPDVTPETPTTESEAPANDTGDSSKVPTTETEAANNISGNTSSSPTKMMEGSGTGELGKPFWRSREL